MQISILLFAGLADVVGQSSIELELPEGATVRDLINRLAEKYPHAEKLIRNSAIALNQEYAEQEQEIHPNAEVAVIPPVSGGEKPFCSVTEKPLSADELIQKVTNPYAGAVLTFAGTVREFTHGQRTVSLEYEAYAPMAVRKMEEIGEEIEKRWPGVRIAMAHRIGNLRIGEISLLIAVASPHRNEAFESGHYAIERLKEIVPIWKKEIWEDGSAWQGPQTGPWDPRKKPGIPKKTNFKA